MSGGLPIVEVSDVWSSQEAISNANVASKNTNLFFRKFPPVAAFALWPLQRKIVQVELPQFALLSQAIEKACTRLRSGLDTTLRSPAEGGSLLDCFRLGSL